MSSSLPLLDERPQGGAAGDAAAPSSPVTTASARRWRARPFGFERVAWVVRVAILAAAVVVVEILVDNGTLNPLFVAAPTDAFETLWTNLTEGDALGLLGATLLSTTLAFAGAAVIGAGFGYCLWRFRDLGRALEPVLVGLFAAPIILLYPVFLLVFERTVTAVVVQALIGGLVPVIITTKRAFAGVRPIFLTAANMLCTSRRQAFRSVLLPAAMPGLVGGLRMGLIYTLLTVLATEYLTGIGGVGAEISESYARLQADGMYAALIMVVGLTAAFMYGLSRLERAFAWKGTGS